MANIQNIYYKTQHKTIPHKITNLNNLERYRIVARVDLAGHVSLWNIEIVYVALHGKTYSSSAGQRVLSCYNSYASQVWGRNIKCEFGPQGVPIWRTGPSKCKNVQF